MGVAMDVVKSQVDPNADPLKQQGWRLPEIVGERDQPDRKASGRLQGAKRCSPTAACGTGHARRSA